MSWSQLLGRDAHSQRMKALHDIERCYTRLSSILQMGVFDPDFDKERRALQMNLDDFHRRLRDAVTYNDWWSLVESKIKDQRAGSPDFPIKPK